MLEHNQNFERVVSGMKTLTQLPQVELRHFAVASADTAKVIVRVTHKNNSNSRKDLIVRALRERFGNALEPVPSSFTAVSTDAFSDTLKGMMRVIRPSIPFVEGQTKGFAAYATNMFMDNEKNIWTLKKTDAGNLLVQTSSLEDESSLLDLLKGHVSVSSTMTPEYRTFMSVSASFEDVGGGDLVSYVGRKAEFALGFVCASVEGEGEEKFVVLAHNDREHEVVSKHAILHAFDTSDLPAVEEDKGTVHTILAATRTGVALEDILSYYKMVYSRRPEYFKQFEARLRSHCFM